MLSEESGDGQGKSGNQDAAGDKTEKLSVRSNRKRRRSCPEMLHNGAGGSLIPRAKAASVKNSETAAETLSEVDISSLIEEKKRQLENKVGSSRGSAIKT